ncbi:MAG TPA: hypothetical protein VMK05_16860 [Burkholderiales bacterium]|nr:hypothetical protein [Burkholderiales bacterium]
MRPLHAKDLQALKLPLVALAAAVLIGTGSIYYTRQGVESAERRFQQQDRLLREARTRLQKSGDEKDVITRYLGSYQQLQAQGLIGPEQRINWLDGLRLTNQQAELFGASYRIGVQQPYPYASEFDPGKLSLNQSLMTITFSLLHEGDLMHFFKLLEARNVGIFAINQCVLDRQRELGRTATFQPHLRAECEIAWITITAEPVDTRS